MFFDLIYDSSDTDSDPEEYGDQTQDLCGYKSIEEKGIEYEILFDSNIEFEPFSFKSKVDEIKFVLGRVRQKLNILEISSNSHERISLPELLELIFMNSEWGRLYKERINIGLKNINSTPINRAELLQFFEFKALCHFYNKSPTALLLERSSGLCIQPKMSRERFFEIINALDSSLNTEGNCVWLDSATQLSEECEEAFLRFSNLFHKIAFNPNSKNTLLTVDDDKIRKRSSRFYAAGVKMGFHRGGKNGPTAINVLSKHSHLLLGSYILKFRDTDTIGAKIAISSNYINISLL
jgi:hypothetical protein